MSVDRILAAHAFPILIIFVKRWRVTLENWKNKNKNPEDTSRGSGKNNKTSRIPESASCFDWTPTQKEFYSSEACICVMNEALSVRLNHCKRTFSVFMSHITWLVASMGQWLNFLTFCDRKQIFFWTIKNPSHKQQPNLVLQNTCGIHFYWFLLFLENIIMNFMTALTAFFYLQRKQLLVFFCLHIWCKNQIKCCGPDSREKEAEDGEPGPNYTKTELLLRNNDIELLQKEIAGNIDKWLEVKRLYITFFFL